MAKLITDEEARQLGLRPFGKKHFVRVLIEQLEVGQKLAITRVDFKWKNQNPNYFINPLMKATNKKFTTQKTANGTAWVVTRTE